MKMHPGRILGIIMGLVILASVFLLPFVGSQTLYASTTPVLNNLTAIQQSGDFPTIASSYITVIVLVLLVMAGLVGIFPLGTGIIGVFAMALFTVGPILIYPSLGAPSYGAGYFVIWGASIASLAASFWHRRRDKKVTVNNEVTITNSAPAGAPQPQQWKLSRCGSISRTRYHPGPRSPL